MNQPDYSSLPNELKNIDRWVGYKMEPDENGKMKKVPMNSKTGGQAQSNNPKTWANFETACKAVEKYNLDGIGIMFGNGLCGIDIDDCITDGKPSDLAKDIVKTMKSYTEYSPSGKGLHILFGGDVEDNSEYFKKNERLGVEIYKEGRFFTVTGKTIRKIYPIRDCSEQIKIIREKYMKRSKKITYNTEKDTSEFLSDDVLIKKAREAHNGKIFSKLWNGDYSDYPSQNEADLALCNILAFWTIKDKTRIDNLFKKSGLMRNKWFQEYSGTT